jgi:carbonic anhydrase
MKKKIVVICLLFLIAGYGAYYFMSIDSKKNLIESSSSSDRENDEHVLNLENSPLYAAIVADDRIFETTYTPQVNILAPRRAVIATCMDHRLNDFLGSVTKGTYILRNAGGRVTEDWIRSLVILYKVLQVEEVFLIQHTDCGMQKFTDAGMKDLLKESSGQATLVQNCNVTLEALQLNNSCSWNNKSHCAGKTPCVDSGCIDWLTIKDGLFSSVFEDVKKIRNHPLIPSNIPVYGFIFDVITGHLTPVPEAMDAGKAKPLPCK